MKKLNGYCGHTVNKRRHGDGLSVAAASTLKIRSCCGRQVSSMNAKSVADVEGPWVEPELNSGLIQRCRDNWSKPVSQVTNHVLATFIRQKLALAIVVPEAENRLKRGYVDDTELYDEELEVAINELSKI